MPKTDEPKTPKDAAATTGSGEARPARAAKLVRGALVALLFATVAILSINDLNSYDTWTHLATGRLMWEESRIPDHEPYSYTQNVVMTLDEASPQYTVRKRVIDANGRLVVPAGTPFDAAAKEKFQRAGAPESEVKVRLEPPLRQLLSDAHDVSGRTVLSAGTLLGDPEIATLRAAGVTHVETTVPWINHEWLFQIPAYLSYKWFGMPGPTIFKALIVTGAFFVVFLAVYRKETHLVGILVVFLAAITSYKRFFMRPEIFSFLFTAAWICLLERFRRKPEGWSICVWLPLLMIVWINTHGYFILGVAILLIYLLGEFLQSVLPMPRALTLTLRWKEGLIAGKALGKLALATALTIAATFVNPYGIDGARYPLDVLGQVLDPTSVIRTLIGEMQPPFGFSYTWAVWFTKWLIVLSALSWLVNLRRLKLSRLLLWGVSIVFMMKAMRNMPFFGIPGAMFLAINVNEAWDDVAPRARRFAASTAALAVKWAAQVALAALLVTFFFWNLTDRFYVNDLANIRCGLGYSEDKFSMEAIEWVRDHPVDGPLFNAFGMGGLCMWKLYPETRVGPDGVEREYYGGRRLFIDGRAEMYGGRFVKDYTRALSDNDVWQRFDGKYRFGVVFLNWQAGDTQPLMRYFYQSPEWALCYGDGVGYVFVRRTAANRAVIEQARRALENPQFVSFAGVYATLERAMPGLPPRAAFDALEDRLRLLARITNADPRLGDQARRESDSPQEVPFDHRLMANRYDRVRETLPFLPTRVIDPGEMIGIAGFAVINGYQNLSAAVFRGLLARIEPGLPNLSLNLGNLHQQFGEQILQKTRDLKQARPELETALLYYLEAERRKSDFPQLSSQLLRLYDDLGDVPNTVRYLRRLTRDASPTVTSTTLAASFWLRANHPDEALRQYRIALSLLPEAETAPLEERIAYCLVGLRRFPEALDHARRAVDLDNASAINWYTHGLVCENLGRRDETIQSYRTSVRLDPKATPASQRLERLLSPAPPPRKPAMPPPYGLR